MLEEGSTFLMVPSVLCQITAGLYDTQEHTGQLVSSYFPMGSISQHPKGQIPIGTTLWTVYQWVLPHGTPLWTVNPAPKKVSSQLTITWKALQ